MPSIGPDGSEVWEVAVQLETLAWETTVGEA